MANSFIANKYTRLYFAIIERRIALPFDGYVEKHHIIPKSMGGSNNRINLVRLPLREHFLCHRLLVKMTVGQDRHKMICALKAMMLNNGSRDLSFTSRTYDALRSAHKEAMRAVMMGKNKGKTRTAEQKARMAVESTGKFHTDASIELMSQKRRERTSQPWDGLHHKEESKLKIGDALRGKPRPPELAERLRSMRVGKAPWNKGLKGQAHGQ